MSVTCGIDIGTSGIKAALVDEHDSVIAHASRSIKVSIPLPGWSEQNPQLWVDAVFDCLDELAARHRGLMQAVRGIGLSGQMLAALLLDEHDKPVRDAMLWNDQRAIEQCAELLRLRPLIGQTTNGAPDPGLTAAKLLWLRQHEPQVLAKAKGLLLPKDYVRLALTGESASDPTDAGGTQLFNCVSGAWDQDICELVGWDPQHLPPILAPWQSGGTVLPTLAARWHLKKNVPVAVGAGDNMATTLGAGAVREGDCVLTIGTSGVACAVSADFRAAPDQAILTSAHAVPGAFLSMGVVMAATQALDWVSALTGQDAARLAKMASNVVDNGTVSQAPVFLPCLTGIRTPLNRPDASARIDGLHPGVGPTELAYATLEGVAFQFAQCVAAQASAGIHSTRFMAVGGGSRSQFWVRLLATMLNQPIAVARHAHDSAVLGAARLAQVAAGDPADTLLRSTDVEVTIEPDASLSELLVGRKSRFESLLP